MNTRIRTAWQWRSWHLSSWKDLSDLRWCIGWEIQQKLHAAPRWRRRVAVYSALCSIIVREWLCLLLHHDWPINGVARSRNGFDYIFRECRCCGYGCADFTIETKDLAADCWLSEGRRL